MRHISLIHRTFYWGRDIEASRRDRDIDFPAIWTQLSFKRGGCCRGFGVRWVCVDDEDLLEVHDGEWNIFLVEELNGRNEEHYFYKFVLIPHGANGYGKKTCRKKYGWKFAGAVEADDAVRGLQKLLKPYYTGGRVRRR